MIFGVAREIKPQEGRVSLLPVQVERLIQAGHEVLVESNAGKLSGAADSAYEAVGAKVVDDAAALYKGAETIVKVKEILPPEYDLLEKRHIIFTNLHTALNRELTDKLLDVGCTGLSAEDMHQFGTPNSPLAGEVGALEALRLCMAPHGGTGRHFLPQYGSTAIKAVVIGLGGAGLGAVRVLTALGCSVLGLDDHAGARYKAGIQFSGSNFTTGTIEDLEDQLADLDLLVNCVRWDKTRTDHLLSRADLLKTKETLIIADVSCDEAGAIETSRPTSWEEPTYREEGRLHFVVDNIPGAVPVAASAGYGNALLPFLLELGEKGVLPACRDNQWLANGLTCVDGELILRETGHYQNRPYTEVDEFLAR
ncbi:alanine dehydrogenase [Rhodovibrionaceae bacterium A322]